MEVQSSSKGEGFTWKLCHNSLATSANLHLRHINVTGKYRFCSHLNEDDLHIFIKCEFATLVWNELGFNPDRYLRKVTSWLQLLYAISEDQNLHNFNLEKFLVCLWGLWKARNRVIFSRKRPELQEVVTSSLDFLNAFWIFQAGRGIIRHAGSLPIGLT